MSVFRQVIQFANFAFRSLTLHREEYDRVVVLLLIDIPKMFLAFTLKWSKLYDKYIDMVWYQNNTEALTYFLTFPTLE